MTIPHCFVAMTAAVLSWACLFTSTARGQAVEVTDPNVEAAIRSEINKPTGDLTAADLLRVTELDLSSQNLSTLTLPEGLTNLERLDLSSNELANTLFSPLRIPADLTSLTFLDISGNNLSGSTSTNFLSTMPALTTLDLSFNARSSLSLPDNLTNLVELTAANNNITDATLPESLVELVSIDLSFNQVGSLTIPSSYTKLEDLTVVSSGLTEIHLNGNLVSLTNLALEFNQLESLTIPAGLSNLITMTAYSNNIEEVRLPDDLFNLQRLDLEDNDLETLRFPVGMDAIQGILIRFNENLTTLYVPEYLERYVEDTFTFAAPNAEIIILPMDPEFTRITKLEGGNVELLLVGRESTYIIYRSTDLMAWEEFDNIISFGSRTLIVDEAAKGLPAVFYRVEEIPEQ